MARRSSHIDWTGMFTSNIVPIVGFIVAGLAFYYTTNNTLQNHERQFVEVGKKFDSFNDTLKNNFAEWTKTNKLEQEKAERNAKEERETRDKLREQFTTLFSQLSQSSIATKVQVDSITKNIDSLQTKIDSISSVQQEGRILRQQQQTGGRR